MTWKKVVVEEFEEGTYLESEAACNMPWQFKRKGKASHDKASKPVKVRAAVADTFFSIPATTKEEHGYLYMDNGVLTFAPHDDQPKTPSQYRKRYREDN